jgi:hypothetical protein
MTDDELFGHLDDPAAPMPNADVLGAVVRRGRHIRARRRSLLAASGAAAAVVVVLGGLGAARALDAGDDHDDAVPLVTVTSTPDPSRSPHRHQPRESADPGAVVGQPRGEDPQPGGIGPDAPVGCQTAAPDAVAPPAEESATPDASPTVVDPSATPSQPAPAPSPSEDCPTATPSPDATTSPSPTDTAQPSPTGTATPTEVVSAG